MPPDLAPFEIVLIDPILATGGSAVAAMDLLVERGAKHVRMVNLVAAIPGTYTGPASRAYLYYGDEHKTWVPGFQVEIAAR